MQAFSFGVETNAIVKEDYYYIIYKGKKLKYIKCKSAGSTDTLVTCIRNDTEIADAYSLMTEFMRAFAYTYSLNVVMHEGMLSSGIREEYLSRYIGGARGRKVLPLDTRVDELVLLPPIDTPIKAELLRLYTDAKSCHNVCLSILFYWHCLVYPSPDDQAAVDYINKNLLNIQAIEYSLDTLKNEGTFGEVDLASLGEYIKNNVRNSLAHIVRKHPNSVNLSLDNWYQMRALHSVSFILQSLARHRLDRDFGFFEFAGLDTVRYFTPEPLG